MTTSTWPTGEELDRMVCVGCGRNVVAAFKDEVAKGTFLPVLHLDDPVEDIVRLLYVYFLFHARACAPSPEIEEAWAHVAISVLGEDRYGGEQ